MIYYYNYHSSGQSETESELLYNWRSVLVSWCRAQIRTFDQRYYFFFESYSLVLFGAPSLTRGRVCHLSVYSQCTVVSIYIKYLHTVLYTFDIYNIYNIKHIHNKENKIQYVQYTSI
jgi:hypothetical protein